VSVLTFNPLDPRLIEDPHSVYRPLRAQRAVHDLRDSIGCVVVFGLEEGEQAFRLGDDLRFLEFQRKRQGEGVEREPYCRGLSEFVLMKAGEDHRRVRGTFSRHFGPSRVAAMQGRIEANVRRLIDGFVAEGEIDLIERFASPLVLANISHLLDVPESDQPQIVEWLEGFKVSIQALPMDPRQLAIANAGIAGLTEYFTELIAQRRRSPGDDLLSMLIAEADAGHLTEAELVSNAWGLYAAGGETTTGAIGNAVIALLDHPDQLQLLLDEPTRLPDAVEELMRYAGPGQAQVRLMDHEIELGGHVIPPDTPILIYFAACSRDERVYADGERLDITRSSPRGHLGFGSGAHKCAGQHLARATLAASVTGLFTRLSGLRIVGDVEWPRDSMLFRGPVHMNVAWDASRPR
jgi:pimeloyl-[acyl-carrier protein] synthase